MTLKRILQNLPAVTAAAALSTLLAGAAGAQESQPVRALKKTVQVAVAASGQRLPLDLPVGHVVQLRIAGDNVQVDLRDAQGHHLRRLAENGRGVQTAMWRTQGAQQEQLWATPAQAGILELLVEDQGRINYGPMLGEEKGLIGPARTGRRDEALLFPLDERKSVRVPHEKPLPALRNYVRPRAQRVRVVVVARKNALPDRVEHGLRARHLRKVVRPGKLRAGFPIVENGAVLPVD